MTKTLDTIGHFVIVLAIIISATYLAVEHVIQADAIATVYGVALGVGTIGALSKRTPTTSTTEG